MKFIQNMRVSVKLILLVVVAAICMIALCFTSIIATTKLEEQSNKTYSITTIPLNLTGNARASFQYMKVNLFDAILADEADFPVFEANALELFNTYKTSVTDYKEIIDTSEYDMTEDADKVTVLYNKIDELEALITDILYHAGQGDTENALFTMTVSLLDYSEEVIPIMRALSDLNVNQSYRANLDSKDLNVWSERIIIVIFLLGIIILIGMSALIINAITKPIKEMVYVAQNIAKGELNSNIQYSSEDELGNLLNHFKQMTQVITSLIEDMNRVADEHEAGDIDARIESDKFEGAYAIMAEKVNEMVSDYVSILNEVFKSYDGVKNGDFDLIRVKEYPGKRGFATTQTDNLRENLKAISIEIASIAESASHGDLDTRANVDSFKGDWKEILLSMNKLLDSFSEPIKDAVTALKQVANGNINIHIDKDYEGAFNDIKIALNDTVASLGEYISVISDTVNQVAQNNLTVHIGSDFKGDFAIIKTSLNQVIEKFNNIISEIDSAAGQVNSGARQISESSMKLAEGATEQASSIDRLTHNVQAINQQTQMNADVSNKANELSIESKESAQRSNQEMQNMLEAMAGIREASDNIASIIKVIEDIAFQTNLLALNAAVEAARAGEHGKGFAVVSDEVRSLAGKSQAAAKETTELIQTSIEKVAKGTEIANYTAKALNVVVDDITEVSSLIDQIDESSSQQAHAITQVMESLEQISLVIQNNSATSEESASASEELSSQAELLSELTKSYITRHLS